MIKSVAIVGVSGHLGGVFARALVATGKYKVTGLTRGNDADAKKIPAPVCVVTVNYENENELIKVLKGHEFLVIALGVRAPEELHRKIVISAGKAGVQYIMPNCYGFPLPANGVIDEGDEFGRILSERISASRNGFSSLIILYCGVWYEWSLSLGDQWFGIDIKNRQVNFLDDGNRIITTTTWDQCGRCLVSLLNLPIKSSHQRCLEDFVGRPVIISSFRVSQRDMLDSVHRVLKTADSDWNIKYSTCQERIKEGEIELQKGNPTGYAKKLYATMFSKQNKLSDYAGIMNTDNQILNLPQEKLDDATNRAIQMVQSGWTP